ncbi:hypothetical protein C8Q73DRAFT_614250, partial [Cubamyces lactineus]
RPHPGTPVATEFIPAWHRSSAAPADIPQPSPAPPQPLHYYQQWHPQSAPAPRIPVVASPAPMLPHQAGISVPLPHPQPSSYLISQLPYLMERVEEEVPTPSSQSFRSQSVVPGLPARSAQHTSQGSPTRRRGRRPPL